MINNNLEEIAERRRIARIKSGVEDELLANPGVNAVDVDYKTVGGETTDKLSIVIWVDSKRKVSEEEMLPLMIKDIPTDIVEGSFNLNEKVETESEESDLLVNPSDPLIGGISIGPWQRDTAGTLGVIFLHNGTPTIMSNFHVLASGLNPQQGDRIVQPARPDGGTQNMIVGDYTFGLLGQPSNVDVAVAQGLNRFGFANSVTQIGTITGEDVTFPGDYVCKYGRTSRFTSGVVISDTFTCQINYPMFGPQTFYNQIRVRNHSPHHPFQEPGDSGSLLVNETQEAVGLLFGSFTIQNPNGNIVEGIANPIHDVFRALGLNKFGKE